MNKKGNIALYILIGLVVIVFFGILIYVGMYNGLVNSDESVRNTWSKVQTAYQRRADLIPNLVSTVKGARDFEQETQTQIALLRSQAAGAQQKVASANTAEELNQAGAEMSGVLSRLMVVVEAYPDLKSNENFLALQDELAGTENRVKWERDNYNDAVKTYRTKTRSFPTSIVAGMAGFYPDKWEQFQAEPGSEVVPQVVFT